MNRPFTSYDKWIVALTSGSLFLNVSSPIIDSFVGLDEKTSKVTLLLIKATIFTIIIRLLLQFTQKQNQEDTDKTKNNVSIISGISFIVFAFLFDQENISSLLISSVVFTLFVRFLIN